MLEIGGCLGVSVGTVLATDSNYKQQIGDSSTLFIGTQWGRHGAISSIVGKA